MVVSCVIIVALFNSCLAVWSTYTCLSTKWLAVDGVGLIETSCVTCFHRMSYNSSLLWTVFNVTLSVMRLICKTHLRLPTSRAYCSTTRREWRHPTWQATECKLNCKTNIAESGWEIDEKCQSTVKGTRAHYFQCTIHNPTLTQSSKSWGHHVAKEWCCVEW